MIFIWHSLSCLRTPSLSGRYYISSRVKHRFDRKRVCLTEIDQQEFIRVFFFNKHRRRVRESWLTIQIKEYFVFLSIMRSAWQRTKDSVVLLIHMSTSSILVDTRTKNNHVNEMWTFALNVLSFSLVGIKKQTNWQRSTCDPKWEEVIWVSFHWTAHFYDWFSFYLLVFRISIERSSHTKYRHPRSTTERPWNYRRQ